MGCPYTEDYGIFGSILGSPSLWKLPDLQIHIYMYVNLLHLAFKNPEATGTQSVKKCAQQTKEKHKPGEHT